MLVHQRVTFPAKHCSKCPRVCQDFWCLLSNLERCWALLCRNWSTARINLAQLGPSIKEYPIKAQMGIAMVTNPKAWDNIYIYNTTITSDNSIHLYLFQVGESPQTSTNNIQEPSVSLIFGLARTTISGTWDGCLFNGGNRKRMVSLPVTNKLIWVNYCSLPLTGTVIYWIWRQIGVSI